MTLTMTIGKVSSRTGGLLKCLLIRLIFVHLFIFLFIHPINKPMLQKDEEHKKKGVMLADSLLLFICLF